MDESRFVSTIVGCNFEGRDKELYKSLEQIHELGVKPEIFWSGLPVGKEQSRINQKRARDWAVSQGKDLLFFEDDIDINIPLFRFFLPRAVSRTDGCPTFFYAHDNSLFLKNYYESDVIKKVLNPEEYISPSVFKVPIVKRLFFAQAVYIPFTTLVLMSDTLRDYSRGNNGELIPTDMLLTLTLQKHKMNAFITLPHPVQHRHVRIGRENESEGFQSQKFSRTYERGLKVRL
jgi:hypothetical protein